VLKLVGNQIDEVPKSINQMTQLRELHLAWNRLTTLPREIGEVTSLEKLLLSSNRIVRLPIEVGLLTRLHALYLDNNPDIITPPKQINNKGTYGIVQYLLRLVESKKTKILDLTRQEFDIVPPEVCELDMLETLILHENGLPSLRPEIGNMTNLTALSLTGNYLAELPGLGFRV
jgi:Leucine-rich repeat (LRR) protein